MILLDMHSVERYLVENGLLYSWGTLHDYLYLWIKEGKVCRLLKNRVDLAAIASYVYSFLHLTLIYPLSYALPPSRHFFKEIFAHPVHLCPVGGFSRLKFCTVLLRKTPIPLGKHKPPFICNSFPTAFCKRTEISACKIDVHNC